MHPAHNDLRALPIGSVYVATRIAGISGDAILTRVATASDRVFGVLSDRATIFKDREEAGRRLAEALAGEHFPDEVVVLALPRGGLPVGYPIAMALDAPLDVLVVRKLGAPLNPELAIGAVASGGVTIYNEELLEQMRLTEEDIEPTREREEAELARREREYRGDRPLTAVEGKTVILVDDGIATGATMRAGVAAIRMLQPGSVIVAVPTAARDSVASLEKLADRVIALSTPVPYIAVGAWYEHFPQLADAEVIEILSAARQRGSVGAGQAS